MKAKDIFLLAVRLLGLVFLYHGLMALPAVMQLFFQRNFVSSLIGILLVLWPLAVAWWLIGGAPQLMRLAYPENNKDGGATGAAPGRLP
jgi:hypothetical protein